MEQYYVPANEIVKAEQAKVETKVKTPNGIMTAKVGDWILTDNNNQNSIVSNEVFQNLYYIVKAKTNEENKFKKMLKMIKG